VPTLPSVIVVDDDEVFAGLMCEVLADEGFSARAWHTAAGAAAYIRQNLPSMVLLDLRMEESDSGLTVLRALREMPETRDLPVIMCTVDERFVAEHAELLAMLHADVVVKPLDLDVLVDHVRRAIDGSTPF
jgi:CheY-like chemotaxis protein